ncbi:M14 family zinc carboxypeptidase [Thalassiella azotivora]
MSRRRPRPSRRPLVRAALGLALGAALVAPAAAGTAAPAPPGQSPRQPVREAPANGPERSAVAATTADPDAGGERRRPSDLAYPRQQVLPEPPVDPTDASLRLGLVPYHELAPRLNALQAASDRVSVEVIGTSGQGRDLYLVTLTSPESPGQALQQQRLRDRIKDQSAQAARDRSIPNRYKAPVLVNANIHGNEWEGTDAALRVVTDLATSEDPAVDTLLDRSRLYFVMTMNPDGRVANTRANANGFDMNRDFATATQAEVRAVRQVVIDTQPLVMLDLHGYVNGTLIEPTTPPHGENYEYDLFIKHAYPNGLAMEAAVNGLGYTEAADGVEPVQIPFRDWDEGWDDWPPIFTPQYAAFHGAVSHTIEIPLRVNNQSYGLPVEELRRRSAINTDIAEAAVRAAVTYTDTHRTEMVADQIELFRRGAAGEPQRPVTPDLFPEIGPEDVYVTDFPEAYLIPTGEDQRSEVAAARLVDHLVANDVDVVRASAPVRVQGRTYPAGSYVVDMHQPKRGMANVLLAAGSDISADVDAMYDVSGWSLGLLWGATVVRVDDERPRVVGRDVRSAAPTGSLPDTAGDLELRLDDPAEVRALNDLLVAGVPVRWTDGGSVVVPAAHRGAAAAAVSAHGVVLTPADEPGGPVMESLTVAAAVANDELWALRDMGFDVLPVSTAVLDGGFGWDGVDVLMVSSGLDVGALSPDARAALEAWVDDGGVVTRGRTGSAANGELDLLTLTPVAGRSDANGVVTVDNASGPLTAGAPGHSFVYSPRWFTDLGPEVAVEQRFTATGPLVSGHWRATSSGTGGQDAARGQALVVRGVDESGAAVVSFGSEPLFRAHPKGLHATVARALHWTALTAS